MPRSPDKHLGNPPWNDLNAYEFIYRYAWCDSEAAFMRICHHTLPRWLRHIVYQPPPVVLEPCLDKEGNLSRPITYPDFLIHLPNSSSMIGDFSLYAEVTSSKRPNDRKRGQRDILAASKLHSCLIYGHQLEESARYIATSYGFHNPETISLASLNPLYFLTRVHPQERRQMQQNVIKTLFPTYSDQLTQML